MIRALNRLTRDQRRTWAVVAGVITVGTIFKVSYFSFSRQMIVEHSNRKQKEGLEHLREAREFAEWSRKDRESRVPQLTPEQREQMRQYLLLVNQHGLNKSFAPSDDNCVGCPMGHQGKRLLAKANGE